MVANEFRELTLSPKQLQTLRAPGPLVIWPPDEDASSPSDTAVRQIRHALADLAVATAQLDPYLTLKQLAAYSGLSTRELRRALVDPVHPLPHRRRGKAVRVRVSEFDRWFAQYKRVGAGAADVDRIVRAAIKSLR